MKFARLFSEHAVLQRGMAFPVWGWSAPNDAVSVEIAGNTALAKCDENGKFLVTFPAHEAGGPHCLIGKCGTETIVISDIYFGEVWLAGGQSNMEMPLTGFDKPLMDKAELDALRFPATIRMMRVSWNATTHACDDINGTWLLCNDSSNYPMLSAQAVFFAEKLAQELNGMPIGIISSNWGGTVAEAWISREALQTLPFLQKSLMAYEDKISSPQYWANLPEFVNFNDTEHYDALTGTKKYHINELFDYLNARPCLLPQNHHDEQLSQPDLDDSNWITGDLPGRWTETHHIQSMGIVWFRKTIEIPQTWEGHSLELMLGAIDKQDKTYFNGTPIGNTGEDFDDTHWNDWRHYHIDGSLVHAGPATIAVRAFSFAFNGGINGPTEQMRLYNPQTNDSIPLNGTWKGYCSLSYNCIPGYLTSAWQENESPISYCDAWNSGEMMPNSYHILFDSMISPIIPYAIRGVIWNQGCSNQRQPQFFKDVTATLINDWKTRWNQPDFAFIQTLLCGFDANWNRPQLRQAQIDAAKATNTCLVNSMDIGDKTDLHPSQKRELGRRTALVALTDIYGRTDLKSHGPEFASCRLIDDSLLVKFAYGNNLHAKNSKPDGFDWIDAEDNAYPADPPAFLNDTALFAAVPANAVAIRYGYEEFPYRSNCYNGDDFAMVPFYQKFR